MISLPELKEKISALGLPVYRAAQIYHAVCREGISDFRKMTTLPDGMRRELAAVIDIFSLKAEKVMKSASGDAEKILFRLHDGCGVEAVIMKFRDGRNSVCVSSQAGCRLGCRFCATGASGFRRDLTGEEIFDQVLYSSNLLRPEKRKITNVVYMGMGEPFLNYGNVMKSVRCLNDRDGLDIGARSITISTAGICEGIYRLAGEKLQVNLAVSLHAPSQEVREKIMPVAKMCSMKRLMESVKNYIALTRRRVSYEYVMLKGINDLEKHAHELARLLKGQLCHINLIPYNATGIKDMAGSDRKGILAFRDILKAAGLQVTVRVSLGQEIKAACGQLADK